MLSYNILDLQYVLVLIYILFLFQTLLMPLRLTLELYPNQSTNFSFAKSLNTNVK